MAQKTSINIKPCNIGSSEPHNRRTAEYLARINKEKFYIRTDLMPQNEAWVAPDFGNTSLTERYNQIAAMVKEKTGRAMQTKDRERVNKKTGKVTIVRGSTPLKEGVVVIKEDTTMEQLRHFCEVCKERWGITPLQVFIHRDEGHYSNPEDIATWKPNLHAHIVWDWMNHETGKSCKLDEKAMCEMQTVLAECLEMQRGTSKKLTGKEHLERNFFTNFTASGTGLYSTADGSLGIPGGNLPVFLPDASGQFLPNGSFAYFPGIDLNYKIGPVYMGSVQVEQPLYMGGKIRAAYKMSVLGKEMAQMNETLTATEVLLKTDRAYTQVVKAMEMKTVAEKYNAVLTELMKNVESAHRHGLKPPVFTDIQLPDITSTTLSNTAFHPVL